MGDVDADPLALEPLRDGDCGAAAAEGVKDYITLVAGGGDDALKQGLGFLGGVAEAFFGLRVDGRNVVPHGLDRGTLCISSRYLMRRGYAWFAKDAYPGPSYAISAYSLVCIANYARTPCHSY